jgi:hypothetical protein
MGTISEYIRNMIAKQVDDNGLVVWYDPDRSYTEVAEVLELIDTIVLRYEKSFIELRWQIDQKKLMDGKEPPHLVVYVPMAQEVPPKLHPRNLLARQAQDGLEFHPSAILTQ